MLLLTAASFLPPVARSIEQWAAKAHQILRSGTFSTTHSSRVVSAAMAVVLLIGIPATKVWLQIGQHVKQSTQDSLLISYLYYWVVWYLVIIGGALAQHALRKTHRMGLVVFLVVSGLVFEVFSRFSAVNHYPFSLGWSESSRYYYASLYFSEWLYGQTLPLSVLHPSRYLLQSIAYLIPDAGLFEHRLWQAILWVLFTAITAILLPKRTLGGLIAGNRLLHFLFSGWVFLFLLRIGVYYHLHPLVFLPLLAGKNSAGWKKWSLLLVASVWAGISRINWFPIPGTIMALLYLFETPLYPQKLGKYLAAPAAFIFAGSTIAMISQWAYIRISGNLPNQGAFTSSFTSDLLWYRLLPNESYPLGVLFATFIFCFPLAVFFITNLGNNPSIQPIRKWVVTGINLVFLAGSLVVSVKIGGGADLHNMDAFAAVLLISTALSFSGISQHSSEENAKVWEHWFSWPTAFVGLLIPVLFLLPSLKPFTKFHTKNNQAALNTLVQKVGDYSDHGEVLFINERHLVTFGVIETPLVYDYEAVTLMEMAMSNNTGYLNSFYEKLQNHEFAAIVSGKLNEGIKTSGIFFEENNIWNARVSSKILCYYEPLVISTRPELTSIIEADESKITLLVPRIAPKECR